MSRFGITGLAGYVAPRHLKAIKDTGNTLVAALDPHDSVGIIDSYFPEAAFFTEFERFDRYLEMLRRSGSGIDYLSICSPNFLHDAHIRLALRVQANAICEKPLVIKPWNLDALTELEQETGKKVFTVLQLRLHPQLQAFKKRLEQPAASTRRKVALTYITGRGTWYKYSWKGNEEKSGGIAVNIGVHFFDMLIWLFGKVKHSELHIKTEDKMAGFLELEQAEVSWLLSVDGNDLPEFAAHTGQSTYRSITIDEQELEFTNGFTDLHTKVYLDILSGNGFGIEEARPAIELAHDIRNASVSTSAHGVHPFVKESLKR